MADGPIDNDTLAALLQNEERMATSWRDSNLADEQETAIDYYEAKPFGDEEEGRSQVVTPDVAEVVDYMGISVLRTVASGDRVVEFEANEEEQEQSATEATEAINYIFMRRQDGYKVLGDWLQSGLIEKIGVVKTTIDEDRKRIKDVYTVDEMQLAMLMDEGANITAATDNGDGTFICQIESIKVTKRYIDMPVPSEEFLFSARCRDVDDIGYKAHKVRKTASELVEMGFDRDVIDSLPEGNDYADLDGRSTARWDDETLYAGSDLPGLQMHWLLEEYVNIDLNDDGIAELVQVFRVADTILSIEEVDENPFVVFCPFPRAHRMVGNSLADKVMDIQRIRSVIMRQTLDGIYLTNSPRMWLPNECVDENTIDDILTVRPGGIVRGKGMAGKPERLYEPFDAGNGMSMNEVMIGERESRTGITRLNQGLDADALNKTATGTALMQAQGQQMEEYIARNFAEAMARLFMKKYRLMRANGEQLAIKVEGSFKRVEPQNWSPDMDISIRVGLGSGRKEQRLAYRAQLLAIQKEGLQNGMVTAKQLYNNVAGLIRDAALGNPNDLWIDPDSPEGQQFARQQAQNQQPDPEQMKLQQKAQSDQANLLLKAQTEGAKIQQKNDEAVIDANLELRRQDIEAMLAREGMVIKATTDSQKEYRRGGDLDK